MSRLPHAPLLEVIFELRWQIKEKAQLEKYKYLIGELYSKVKSSFPYRESLIPTEIPIDLLLNKPANRFRIKENDYPLVQLGPGVLTYNTIDEKYFWHDFYKDSKSLIHNFFEVYDSSEDVFRGNLIYIDFFKFDFEKQNVNDYINQNFNIIFQQNFFNAQKKTLRSQHFFF
jgi:uncharacterized protein (TIGR04255 family)